MKTDTKYTREQVFAAAKIVFIHNYPEYQDMPSHITCSFVYDFYQGEACGHGKEYVAVVQQEDLIHADYFVTDLIAYLDGCIDVSDIRKY